MEVNRRKNYSASGKLRISGDIGQLRLDRSGGTGWAKRFSNNRAFLVPGYAGGGEDSSMSQYFVHVQYSVVLEAKAATKLAPVRHGNRPVTIPKGWNECMHGMMCMIRLSIVYYSRNVSLLIPILSRKGH